MMQYGGENKKRNAYHEYLTYLLFIIFGEKYAFGAHGFHLIWSYYMHSNRKEQHAYK